jgi:alkenylglycerophosphocholine/alkenylglycerophosphoethanolamine hydrolase
MSKAIRSTGGPSSIGAPVSMAFVVALATAVAAAVAHLVGEARGNELLALVAKPVPVLLLAGAVALAPRSGLRIPVVAGLLVSALGDVLIQRPGGFVSGLSAFLVAHIVYTFGFWRARPAPLWMRALPVALFSGSMAALVLPRLAGSALAPAVAVYILAISGMLWRAGALPGAPDLPPTTGRLALGGAILFAASDSLIAVHRFVTPLAWASVPIMLLYWLGQTGIAGAALAAARGRTR